MFSFNFMFFCSLIEELCTKEENYKSSCNFNFAHECISFDRAKRCVMHIENCINFDFSNGNTHFWPSNWVTEIMKARKKVSWIFLFKFIRNYKKSKCKDADVKFISQTLFLSKKWSHLNYPFFIRKNKIIQM